VSFVDERNAIETLLNSAWQGRTPVKFENNPFTPPLNQTWIALTILSGAGQVIALNDSANLRKKHLGTAVVQVFTPLGEGTGTGKREADLVANIFRDAVISAGVAGRIKFRTPNLITVGEDEGWYQYNVAIPFERNHR